MNRPLYFGGLFALMASVSSSSMVFGTAFMMLALIARMRAPAAMGSPISLPLTIASLAPATMLSSVFFATYGVTSTTESVAM